MGRGEQKVMYARVTGELSLGSGGLPQAEAGHARQSLETLSRKRDQARGVPTSAGSCPSTKKAGRPGDVVVPQELSSSTASEELWDLG